MSDLEINRIAKQALGIPLNWRERIPPRSPAINVFLFLVTLFSTIFAGTYLAHFDQDFRRFWIVLKYHPELWFSGVPFAVSLLAILLAHEFGHYLVSRYHGVRCSLPYFLPGPNLVGTFGAVILMEGRIQNRRQLFDLGAAGPLCGLAVAVFTMVVGFLVAEPTTLPAVNDDRGMVLFHANFLMVFVTKVLAEWGPGVLGTNAAFLVGKAAENTALNSPLLDAACVGFLVTALNLLPIGQLDGGHVAYAVFGPRAVWLSRMALVGLLGLGYFWPGWFFLGIILFILMGRRGFRHPPPLDPFLRLTTGRKILAFFILIIFILIMAPVPLEIYVSPDTFLIPPPAPAR